MAEKLRIGASSRFHTQYPGGSFTPIEMVEHFRRVGFRGIDFDIATVPEMGEDWRRILGDTAALAAKYDIVMDYGHLPFRKIKVNGVEDKELFRKNMLLCIEAAGFAGIKHAVIHPVGSAKDKPGDGEACFRQNIEELTQYAEQAVKHGVKLAFENMRSPYEKEGYYRYGSRPEEINRIADHFGMEVCWDFGHAHSTKLVQSREIPKLGSRLTVLHVNDNHAGEDDLHIPPFLGTIDWVDAMAGLKQTGFSGCFNYEIKTMRIPPEERDEIAAYCIKIGKQLTALL